MLEDSVIAALQPAITGKTLIITIGNTFRSDDGVGPFIFDALSDIPDSIELVNAGQRPENIIDEAVAVDPAKTILIDAANFGGFPGEARVIEHDLIPDSTMSTHTFPLKVIARLLEKDTGSDVFFVGIQAASYDLGEGLSDAVRETADTILDFYHGL